MSDTPIDDARLDRLEYLVSGLMDLIFLHTDVRTAYETGRLTPEGREVVGKMVALRQELGVPIIPSPTGSDQNLLGFFPQR